MNEDGIFFTIAQDPAVNQVQVSPSVSGDVSWYSSHLGPRPAYLPVMGHPVHPPGLVLQGLSQGHMTSVLV